MYNNVNNEDLNIILKLLNKEIVSLEEIIDLERNIGREKLDILLARSDDVKELIALGFRIETIIKETISVERLNYLLDNKAKVVEVLTLDLEDNLKMKDEELIVISQSRLELLLNNPIAVERYIKIEPPIEAHNITPALMKQRMFNNELIDDATLRMLLDKEKAKRIIDMIITRGFILEGIIALNNREITEKMLSEYGKLIELWSEKNGFTAELLEGARDEGKLGLLMDNTGGVSYLIEQGFSAEEIKGMSVARLNLLLPNQEALKTLFEYGFSKEFISNLDTNLELLRLYVNNAEAVGSLRNKGFSLGEIVSLRREVAELLLSNVGSIDGLMEYGFRKEQFFDNSTRADLLRLMLEHDLAINLFSGENPEGQNIFGIRVRGLEALVSNASVEPNDLQYILYLPQYLIRAAQVSGLREFIISPTNIKNVIEAIDNGWEITETGARKLSIAVRRPNQAARRVGGGGVLGAALGGFVGMVAWGLSKLMLDDAPAGPLTMMGAGGIIGAGTGAGAIYGLDEKRAHHLERAVMSVDRAISTTPLDNGFSFLFRRNKKNQLVFKREFQEIKNFLKEIIVEPILEIIGISQRLNRGKLLAIKALTTIIQNDNIEAKEWEQIEREVQQPLEENREEDLNVVELSKNLQQARIILEKDQSFEGLGRNVPAVMLELDKPSRLVIRTFGLLLAGRNIGYAKSKVEEVEDIRSINIPKMRLKMERISEKTEWDMDRGKI
jgi:hypothetical protein